MGPFLDLFENFHSAVVALFYRGDKVSACSVIVYKDNISSCGNRTGGKKSSPKAKASGE